MEQSITADISDLRFSELALARRWNKALAGAKHISLLGFCDAQHWEEPHCRHQLIRSLPRHLRNASASTTPCPRSLASTVRAWATGTSSKSGYLSSGWRRKGWPRNGWRATLALAATTLALVLATVVLAVATFQLWLRGPTQVLPGLRRLPSRPALTTLPINRRGVQIRHTTA